MNTKKSVLITGCSDGGIGHALAHSFQKRGLQVFATARSLVKMSDLEGVSNVILLQLDVTSASDIAAAVEAVKAKSHGAKLDYLVNNSGRQYYMPALDADIEEGKRLFDVNFWGALAIIQAFQSLLFKAQGTIVNIGSIVGYLYSPWSSIYNASKAADNIFSETLRLELSPLGIKVVTVITGAVASNLLTSGPKAQLPSSSKYASMEKQLVEMGEGNDGISRMSPQDYAERVVSDVLKGATGLIWRGNTASMTRYGAAFMPRFLSDRVLMQVSKLDTMHVNRQDHS